MAFGGTETDGGIGSLGMRQFEEIEHTADVKIRATGSDLAELLRAAAEGMFFLIGRASFGSDELRAVEIDIESRNAEELLILWLQQLLREFNLNAFFLSDCAIRATSAGCRGKVFGGTFDPERHEFRTEIKGVTLHGLTATRVDGEWRAEVIFDV